MKATTSKILLSLTILVVAFSVSITVANADVLYSQTISTTQSATIPNGTPITQRFYTGLATSTLQGVSIRASWNGSGTAASITTIRMRCYQDNFTTFTVCPGTSVLTWTGTQTLTTTETEYYFNFSTTNENFIKSGYSYVLEIEISNAGASRGYSYGANSDVTSSGYCYNNALECGTVQDLFYILYGLGTTIPLQTQVYTVTSPTQFQVTSSADVPVTFTYLYNSSTGVYDKVGVEVIEQSNNRLVLRTSERSIDTTTGIRTFTDILPLQSNKAYRIRGYLRNSSTTKMAFGPYRDFSTISDQFFNSTSTLVNLSQITEINASSTIAQTLLDSINIFSLLANKVPFAYMFYVGSMFSFDNVPATSQAGEVALDLGDIASSSIMFNYGRVVIFSTTTVSTYLGPYLTPILALCDVVLYVTTGLALFAMRRQIFV